MEELVPHSIDTRLIPDKGKEREDWFWDQLDALIQANVNLVSENGLLKEQIIRRDEVIRNMEAARVNHVAEIMQMSAELNAARVSAMTAVEEYRNNVE